MWLGEEIKLFLIFIILHLFLYPASQAYNSYYDNDCQSIGGIEKPPKITREVLLTSYLFDFLAISLSLFFIGHLFNGVFTLVILQGNYTHYCIWIQDIILFLKK